MSHDIDMVAAYVLDALSPQEAEQFEAHLAGCDQCQAEVAELRQVVDVLPLAADPVEPPRELRDRILEAVQEDAASSPGLKVLPGGNAGAPRKRTRLPTVIVAVAAAVMIAFLGIRDLQLQVNNQQVSLQRQVAEALAKGVPVSHVTGTAAAPHATASLVQTSQHAYLIVRGLHPSRASKVYQVWYVRGTTVRSAGVFTYSRGSKIVPLPPATGYPLTAVTVEPGPHGSKLPTGPKVLLGATHA